MKLYKQTAAAVEATPYELGRAFAAMSTDQQIGFWIGVAVSTTEWPGGTGYNYGEKQWCALAEELRKIHVEELHIDREDLAIETLRSFSAWFDEKEFP